MSAPGILDELAARGLIADCTDRVELARLLATESVTTYCGHDPTATSLHLGNLVPIVVQARLQRVGHKPIALVGGATGMIGDPSGKSLERNLLDADTLAANVDGIRAQLARVLDFSPGPAGAVMANNYDWFKGIGFIDFLREVGKHITVNYMMAKESVRSRLEDREAGLSYTEFSYMLLQAWDFVQLSRLHGCKLQIGGSDQWGNITAGTELSHKLGGPRLFGLTAPLLLDSSGQKMGKTSTGLRIWLDPDKTSPFQFYQYWLNTPDADVGRFLKIFSWRSLEEIASVVADHDANPAKRTGQRALAEDITTWIHGADATRRAIVASQVLFGGSVEALTDADLEPLLADTPHSDIERTALEAGCRLVDLLVERELCSSKGEARRLIAGGGAYVNNVAITDPNATVTTANLATQTMLLLRTGKKKYHLLRAR